MGTLIFDGDCGFCTSSAKWIDRRLDDRHSITPWQALPDLAALGLAESDVSTAAYWLDDKQQLFRGELGIGASLRSCTGAPWRVAGAILVAPPVKWIAKPVYKLVAKNRHRLPGSTDACRLDL